MINKLKALFNYKAWLGSNSDRQSVKSHPIFFFFLAFVFCNSVSTNAKHVFLRTNQNEIGSRLTGARSVLLDLDLSLYWCLISVRGMAFEKVTDLSHLREI